jgi:hypothetical protein
VFRKFDFEVRTSSGPRSSVKDFLERVQDIFMDKITGAPVTEVECGKSSINEYLLFALMLLQIVIFYNATGSLARFEN